MPFSRTLVIEKVTCDRWKIYLGFDYVTKDGEWISVPKGFVTDLASIPNFLTPIIPTIGPWDQAAVVHDWLYHQHRTKGDTERSRKRADKIFKQAMLEAGTSDHEAGLIYGAVRFGALESWETPEEKKEREEQEQWEE